MTKKFISIILIFACVLFSGAKANAAASATSQKTIEVSELTLYEEIKKCIR